MTFYARILELHPEYEGMRAADLAAQGMACPAERSAELLGNDGAFCEMENRTPGPLHEVPDELFDGGCAGNGKLQLNARSEAGVCRGTMKYGRRAVWEKNLNTSTWETEETDGS